MTISNSISSGFVFGDWDSVGGFVGSIWSNPDMIMAISNSINNGTITGSNDNVGGFIGLIESDYGITITILNVTNNGTITGHSYVGGLIGHIKTESQIIMDISNCINTGNATGNDNIGGFVGFISSSSYLSSFCIINSANKGWISAILYACGFFCASDKLFTERTSVVNSINKGIINGSSTWGITDSYITKVINTVSMGNIIGYYHCPAWINTESHDVGLFYDMDGKCFNCSVDAIFFQYNTNTRSYAVIESGKHVHDILNDEATKQCYHGEWTNELELVYNKREGCQPLSLAILNNDSPFILISAFLFFFIGF